MAPNFFQKPETALKRAQELIQVGKEQDALDTLHDTIKARRHKQWTQVHEQIMYKHLELCVTLRKPHVAKDALFQYKGLTQQVAVDSLERVIEFFLKLAETKTEEAQKTSIEKVEEIDDLDQGDNPETLLLSVVSGAAAQDRMDRTVLSPWLRFLWDSYRNCLELLRNNSQVEQLYHRITRKSFGFCSRYQRRAEFRKLCDLLRLHLNQIQKNQHMSHVVKLNSAESLTLMQETRLCQLDTAIQMELWQEAYRSAEDVHGMMQLSKDRDKRMVKASSYVNYYDKLALVFWKAGNRLFHAAALLQKFIIYKDMKKSFTSEEALDQATRVLLATLSIPDGADAPSDLTRHLDIEDQHMCNIRLLSNLLRLPISPTRNGILKECARLGVPEMANEQARNLYRLLENNFAPLRLASDTEVELTKVDKPEYEQYVESLRYVIATKALKQIAVIYDSITWTRVRKMIPFFDEETLERFLVDVSKHRIVKAQLDHRSGCVRFGAADATLAGGVDLEDADGFTGDDTQLGVEGIRSHLELMYNKLRSIVESLDSDDMKKEAVDRVKQHAQIYDYHKKTDYERVMMRRRKIENYKETSERAKAEKNQAAEAERARREEQKRAEEMKRLELENQETEKKRRLAEQEEVQRKIRQDQLKKMQNTPLYHAIIKELGEDAFKDMDPEQVLLEQRQRLDAERQAMQQRLQQQEKKFDHHIRALHLEEMIERRSIMQRRLAEAPKLHAEYEERRVTKAIADHEDQVQTYARLEAVAEDSADWIASVKEDRADDFAKKVEEWQNKLDAVRSARLKERAEERKRRRREEWLQHQAMLERRRKEEEERQKQAIIDEQRRAGREARGEPMRRRDDYDSKAMGDSDWRSGPRSDAPRAERPAFDRERSGPGGPPRGGGFERRERENVPPSVADNDSSWRAGPRAAPAPSSSAAPPYRPGMGLSRRDDPPAPSREDFGTAMRRPAAPISRPTPASAGASDGAWSRGNVVKKEAPAPAPAPAAGGADKSGPWRPSFRKEGDAPAGPGGAAPSNRPAAPNPRAIGRPAAPAPKGPGADADRNWRR